MIARHYIILGRVQGVGFRQFVVQQARSLGLVGWVRNRSDGSVEAIAAGPASALAGLEEALRQGPSMSHVDEVRVEKTSLPKETSFVARPTR